MSETGARVTQKAFEQSWRYKLGLTMIVGGHVVLLGAIILPMLGLLSTGPAATGVVVGEVISLASIVFLGKQGFLAIKQKIFSSFRAEFQRPVGRVRHTAGILLLLLNFVTSVTLAVFAWFSYGLPPGADVWGMSLETQANFYATLFFVGELTFPVAIVMLGADWWQRFRELFVWQPSGQAPA